ncbi:MAG: hypothetical protein IT372_08040, partial [Polyangiaceae bacterium]|nr:hypothetical protein [Polyangiaceae bacterium]
GPGCASGQACGGDGDGLSGKCTGDVCVDVLLISEVRSRGPGGADDEFIEIFNPGDAPVTTDATWRLIARNASGTGNCQNNNELYPWTGSGEVIPSHGHLLIGGSAYAGATTADVTAMAAMAIADGASIRLEHDSVVIDAVCFYANASSQTDLTSCSVAYTCEGAPIQNPHDGTNGTDTDDSIERKPGGNGGNATDTGDSSADFQAISPSNPQNLASQATP